MELGERWSASVVEVELGWGRGVRGGVWGGGVRWSVGGVELG